MFVYAFCPSTCTLSLSIPSQLSTGASCVCFFCPSVTPNTKYKSVKIQRQTSCGFHLWNPTKLQEKVLATGLRIPQPISCLEKTGLNFLSCPSKMHQREKARTPSVSVAAAEDGCGVDAPVATVSPRLDGLFSRRRRVFVSLPPCCNACSIFVWTLQQQLHSCVTSRL